jgi:hypothetical protein
MSNASCSGSSASEPATQLVILCHRREGGARAMCASHNFGTSAPGNTDHVILYARSLWRDVYNRWLWSGLSYDPAAARREGRWRRQTVLHPDGRQVSAALVPAGLIGVLATRGLSAQPLVDGDVPPRISSRHRGRGPDVCGAANVARSHRIAAVTGLCGPGRGITQLLRWAAWTLEWQNRWGSFFVAALLLWRRPLVRRGARRSRGAGVRRSLATGTSWCASPRGMGR